MLKYGDPAILIVNPNESMSINLCDDKLKAEFSTANIYRLWISGNSVVDLRICGMRFLTSEVIRTL